jgi:hypothetical protein
MHKRNVFVYGSLMHPKEWKKIVSQEYDWCYAKIKNQLYHKEWIVKVETKPNSRFYQKGDSSMLTIVRKKNLNPKWINGILYYQVIDEDWQKLRKRENYYSAINISVLCEHEQKNRAWAFIAKNNYIEHNLPKNKKYKEIVDSAMSEMNNIVQRNK